MYIYIFIYLYIYVYIYIYIYNVLQVLFYCRNACSYIKDGHARLVSFSIEEDTSMKLS